MSEKMKEKSFLAPQTSAQERGAQKQEKAEGHG
jgi:hypothetical protein